MAAVETQERLRKYAELAVQVGANVQPGQLVDVIARVEHAAVAREVARAAYRAGASYVDVYYTDIRAPASSWSRSIGSSRAVCPWKPS